ncbi:MAG: hypothetical protein JNL60_06340 [Bacteroidia bacterium]|nr:hypothetical protein [Bacteroidia bacterium]
MLPFTDIDFFLFAAGYVALFWLFKFFGANKFYPEITFAVTLFYLVFYFSYWIVAIPFCVFTFLFIRFIVPLINHRLVSATIIAIPMILLKLHLNPPLLYFAGLSFVTFRAMQVSIDYSKEERLNFIHYFNFLFFIPSLYIGPLDRYKRFTENSKTAFKSLTRDFIYKGLEEILKGFTYKFIIAEWISRTLLSAEPFETLSGGQIVSDIYTYTLYLFFDFAGYSAMAVGMANLLGIDLPFNFNMPFIARNPSDFWQRWHASLTNWLTDYFFKPFYKWLSQKKELKKYPITRQNLAIFFTFFLMAVWNGFELNFILSGVVYGIYSVVHNIYAIECRKKDRDVFFGNLSPTLVKYISIFIMFNLVCIALYIFSGRWM